MCFIGTLKRDRRRKILEKCSEELKSHGIRIHIAENNCYGDYTSAIVAADTYEEARAMHPRGDSDWSTNSEWASSVDGVKCTHLGEAKEGSRARVISFNHINL